jgi:hypothetical protein
VGNTLPKGSEINSAVSMSSPTTKVMGLGEVVVFFFFFSGSKVPMGEGLGEWEGVGCWRGGDRKRYSLSCKSKRSTGKTKRSQLGRVYQPIFPLANSRMLGCIRRMLRSLVI